MLKIRFKSICIPDASSVSCYCWWYSVSTDWVFLFLEWTIVNFYQFLLLSLGIRYGREDNFIGPFNAGLLFRSALIYWRHLLCQRHKKITPIRAGVKGPISAKLSWSHPLNSRMMAGMDISIAMSARQVKSYFVFLGKIALCLKMGDWALEIDFTKYYA